MKKLMFMILSLSLMIGCLEYSVIDLPSMSSNMFNTETILLAEVEEGVEGHTNLILSNNLDVNVYISKWDIPAMNVDKDSFKIYGDSGLLPYKGRVYYVDEQMIEWVLIEPGSEIISEVYLPSLYSFEHAGLHSVHFEQYFTVKYEDRSIDFLSVKSKTIDMVLEEEELNMERLAPVKSCSSNEKRILDQGKNYSGQKVLNVTKYLAQKKGDSYYVKWFGRYTTTRYNSLISGFNKMVPSHRKSWTYSCETKANGGCNGWAAFVYKHIPEQTWVCMDYYNRASDNNRGELMTHEASHWNVNFSSDDYVYGKTNSINLAKNSPDKAVDCADNIAFYTWDIPNAGTTPPVDPPDPPVDPPGTDIKVSMYQHSQYRGYRVDLKNLRDYNINRLIRKGMKNDDISSIKVKSGYEVILYEHKDYKGKSITVRGNVTNLRNRNFNDILSSLKLKKLGNAPEPPVEPPVNGEDNLPAGRVMEPKEGLLSANGAYRFWFQADGHLVIRSVHENGKVLWVGGAANKGATRLRMQKDGNLVQSNSNGPIWTSDTAGKGATKLQMLNTGKLVIKNGEAITWSRPKGGVNPPVDPPDNTTAWKFVVGGDTRSNDSAHRSVLRAVRNNTPDYKLYLNSGDVVNNGTSSSDWNTFRNAVNDILGSNWQSKYLACPGNHDRVREGGLSNWNKYLSVQSEYRDRGRNFAYTYKNATFIVLDADIGKDSQVSWIKNTVNNAKTTWVFAIWHYPTYYNEWIRALGDFDGVFFGHQHKYRRENKGSYFGIVVGTGGAPIGSSQVYGYLECKINGNKMTTEYIKASNGAVLDSQTYTASNKYREVE